MMASSFPSCCFVPLVVLSFSGLSFLRSFVKRCRHNLCAHTLPANLDFHHRAWWRELRRHVRQRNILLEERAGDPLVTYPIPRPVPSSTLYPSRRNAALSHFQADQRTAQAFSFRLFQSGATG